MKEILKKQQAPRSQNSFKLSYEDLFSKKLALGSDVRHLLLPQLARRVIWARF